ncbi:hypothetical protein [Actinoplanes sp. RD1]|uniref:hypothetical protein n=1 Tax=Actinoplanes sp. RD1 TaxID=3064538 RepID=UPI0027422439|nr:hypothetical protein [Actinoplanes sp. RD1]
MLRETVEAGRGAPSPDVAANSYLMALGYGQEEGLLPLLDDDHQAPLLAQWRAYRAAMSDTDPPPARFDFGALTVGPVVDGRAEVRAEVAAIWWSANGSALSYRSETLMWRIETSEDGGWRVSAVETPAWCGGYVLATKCHSQ